MITIVNYGMGNLRSVYYKISWLGYSCLVTSDYKIIESAEKLIIPGVGHFKAGMTRLNEMNLINILTQKVIVDKTPVLGICLGAQLFCRYSEEGDCAGLGWFDAKVVRFRIKNKITYKVPHMGWNSVKIVNSCLLDDEVSEKDRFYFVHSYHLQCNNVSDIWMTSTYEDEFVSAIHRHNIFGTQFHPEKSHDAGLSLLKKFAEI